MKCKCGYSFAESSLTSASKYEAYGLVNNKDFHAFLESELAVLKARDQRTKARAIARSSEYVGSLLECPRCKRLLIVKPQKSSPRGDRIFYKRERAPASNAKLS